jgi:hypothetical protein
MGLRFDVSFLQVQDMSGEEVMCAFTSHRSQASPNNQLRGADKEKKKNLSSI